MPHPQRTYGLHIVLCMFLSLAPLACIAQAAPTETSTGPSIEPSIKPSIKAPRTRAVPSPAARFAGYGHDGAWLLKREGGTSRIVHGAPLARKTQVPASTFKVLLALIALDTGVLRGADDVLRWDGQRYPNKPEWQADMALRQAMRTSSEPYFRTLAARIGRDRLAAWVARVGYGNERIGADPARAWHDGVLRVTAEQQLAFIDRLRRGDLPFDRATLAAVKAVLLESETDGRLVYGKTGTHSPQGATPGVGWWIGWVEGGGQPSASFALAVELKAPDERAGRIALARGLLADAGLLSQ
jgi:beta-lactamase class D